MAALLRGLAGCGWQTAPGGSAANVMRGLSSLADEGRRDLAFFGRVGNDAAGRDYARQLAAPNLRACLSVSNTGAATAACLCLVSPSGERTMRTSLGAAAELRSEAQLPRGWAEGAALVHCEGYVLYRPELARGVLRAARQAGALVSLDLASFEVVHGCADALLGLLHERALDIVFCNEQEAEALAKVAGVAVDGGRDGAVEAAQSFLLQSCRVAVVSRGAAGSVARCSSGARGASGAERVEVADTVGAGDGHTSGFLHAYLAGASLDACTACGCAVGAAAVQATGAGLGAGAWERVRQQVCGILAADRVGGCKGSAGPRMAADRAGTHANYPEACTPADRA
ncbi:hypothetical protein WJX81_002890 [Elliptochloris bilobata]|uniref:Carbohydrate kinase PfkB domain-containing protein n=1 Tax=Elliptochloris bilobata TaxID=381761 RepID=A0AAW1RCI0_9CHLO